MTRSVEPCQAVSAAAKKIQWIEYASAISATLATFACGTHFGWVGPTLHQLRSADSPIPVTSAESSWLAGMLPLGGIPGPILGSIAADYLGRKQAILLTAFPFILTWVIISVATNVHILYCAQFLCGSAVGACFTVLPMYVGEISSPAIRGILGNFMSLQFNFGILMEYMIVPYVSIKANAAIAALIPALLLLTFIWMPETPYYYLMKGKENEAECALKTLRRSNDVTEELNLFKAGLKKQQEDKGTIWDLVTVKSNRKGLIIILGILTAQEFSGLSAIISYAQIIFAKSDSPISAEFSGVILAFASFFITIICSLLVDTWGRRPLLLLSSTTTAIPLFAIGMFFYLQHIEYEHLPSLSLLPIVGLIVYKITFGIGLGPLPYVCLGELFPTNVKALASCIVSIYGSITGFIVAKLYQVIADEFGTHVVFWVFATCCILGAAFMYFSVPETKGRTLEEIQDDLKAENQQTVATTKL